MLDDNTIFVAYSFLIYTLGMLSTIAVVVLVDKIRYELDSRKDLDNRDKKSDGTNVVEKENKEDVSVTRTPHYDYVQYNYDERYMPKQKSQPIQSMQPVQSQQQQQPQQVPSNYNINPYKYNSLNSPSQQIEVVKEAKQEKKPLFGFLNKQKKDKDKCEVKIG